MPIDVVVGARSRMPASACTRLLPCLSWPVSLSVSLSLSLSFSFSFSLSLLLSFLVSSHFVRFRCLSSQFRLSSGFLDVVLAVFSTHLFLVGNVMAGVKQPHPL